MANALSLADVVRKTTLRKTAIYAAIKAGTFPKPFKLGNSRSAWLESAVDAWLTACMSAPPKPQTGAKLGGKPKVTPAVGL